MLSFLQSLLKSSGSVTSAVNWSDLGKTVAVAALLGVGTALGTWAAGQGGAVAPLLVLLSTGIVDLAHRFAADNSPATPAKK